MSYEKLLDEIEGLQKSYAQREVDDKAIQQAAGEGQSDPDEDLDEDLDENGKPIGKKKTKAGDGEGLPFGKSFTIVGEDGNETHAVDGTALVKALNDRVASLESELSGLKQSQSSQVETLLKAIQDIGKQGVGRKAVLSVAEKPDTMAKSVQSDGMDGKEFMAKAMTALSSGRISAMDVSIAEGSLNRGIAVPVSIVSRVMGNQ